jgi:hypothetical protein
VVSEKQNKSLVVEQTNFQTAGSTRNYITTIENIPLFLRPIRTWNCLKQDILVPFDVREYSFSCISNTAAVMKKIYIYIKTYVKSAFKRLVQ